MIFPLWACAHMLAGDNTATNVKHTWKKKRFKRMPSVSKTILVTFFLKIMRRFVMNLSIVQYSGRLAAELIQFI